MKRMKNPNVSDTVQPDSLFERQMTAWIAVVRTYNECQATLLAGLAPYEVSLLQHEIMMNLMRAPGLTQPDTRSQAMVELIDIYPTLVDLTGLERPEHLQGESLRPLLGHPDRMGQKKYAYSVVTRGKDLGYALRNRRWRYGKWPDGEELYNLTRDPQEKRNLAGKPHVEETLKEMRALLESRRQAAASRRE